MSSFYSNGKLLLTGEYAILDGALSLALPTVYGQSMDVSTTATNSITWNSKDYNGNTWFKTVLTLSNNVFSTETKNELSTRLIQILTAAKQLNSNFLSNFKGASITTRLDFPNNWGLGSSSTLITNIANWAKVNPYKLLDLSFGGSGYDIACAKHNTALTYKLINGGSRCVSPVCFNPQFKANLFFVHLNKKQNSRESICHYNANKQNLATSISQINTITKQIIDCESLAMFNALIQRHEHIISRLVNLPTIQHKWFSDFKGSIKSLGGWGGDFVLATSKNDPSAYFKSKGYSTIIPYSDMVLA